MQKDNNTEKVSYKDERVAFFRNYFSIILQISSFLFGFCFTSLIFLYSVNPAKLNDTDLHFFILSFYWYFIAMLVSFFLFYLSTETEKKIKESRIRIYIIMQRMVFLLLISGSIFMILSISSLFFIVFISIEDITTYIVITLMLVIISIFLNPKKKIGKG